MAGEIQNITNALKIAYPPKAVEPVLNEELVFRPWLQKSIPAGAKVTDGGLINFGANLGPPQNVGQLVDGGTLPAPKDRTDRQFQLKPTLFAGAIQIGVVTFASANTGKSAFNGGEYRRRTDEMIGNLGKFIESTYVGTAGDGIRGYVDSDGTSTLVMKQPWGVKLFQKNMYISVRQSAGGSVRDSLDLRSITKKDPDTYTLTYSGADQTAVANDPVYVVVEATQASLTTTFANGLRGLIDDGTNSATIHGLTRTDSGNSPELNSVVDENGGTLRNLTEQILLRATMRVREFTEKAPSLLLFGPGQFQKYVEFCAPQRQRAVVTGKSRMNMATGAREEDMVHFYPGGQLNFMLSWDVLPRELYLLTPSTFFHYNALDMQWLDEDSLLKLTPTSSGHKAAYLAYMGSVENIGCDMPRGNAVIRDLKDPSIGDV